MKRIISLGRTSLLLTPLILIFGMAMIPTGMATNTTSKVWADPPRIDGTGRVGQNVTVNVMVDSPDVGVWGWQAGVSFNNTILNCTGFGMGTFFAGHYCGSFRPGIIHNDLGFVEYCGQSLVAPETTGVTGTGDVMYFNFTVLAAGISDLHLNQVKLNKRIDVPPYVAPFPCNVIDVYTVIWEEVGYLVEIVHNFTGSSALITEPTGLSDHAFNQSGKAISFNVTGLYGDVGFCNITIPKQLLNCTTLDEWVVKIDNTAITPTIADNATHTFIYVEFTTTTRTIEIIGTWVIPEFSATMIMPLLLIATLAAAILGKMFWSRKRRRRFISQ